MALLKPCFALVQVYAVGPRLQEADEMAKTRRDLMTAAAVAATLFSGAKAFAAEAEPTTVVLHVSNYARLSPSDLNGAEAEATRIYKAADIKVVWVNPGAAESEAYAGA